MIRPSEAKEYLERGFFLSIPGVITFKNADLLREVVAATPLERLLIETDCPYLAPVPYRGKRNEPAYILEVIKQIGILRDILDEDVIAVTSETAKVLFGLNSIELE